MRRVVGPGVLVVGLLAGMLAAVGVSAGPVSAQTPLCFGEAPTIVVEAFEPTVGTSGDDVIVGTRFADDIRGGGGDDLICGMGSSDVIRGNEGDDQIDGGAGADRLFGGQGADMLVGGAGDDLLLGLRGADVIDGGTGRDQAWGGRADDMIDGGDEDDTLFGNRGQDTILGGSGDDTIAGGKRGDTLEGGSGNDVLLGNGGQDVLIGNEGADDLRGGTGWDQCRGGLGRDSFSSCDPSSPLETGVSSNIVARAQSQGGQAILSVDMIVPPDGDPFIAMRDVLASGTGEEEGSLRLIKCATPDCSRVTESSGSPGLPSLAVGPDGFPVVAVAPVPGDPAGGEPTLLACENRRCTRFVETTLDETTGFFGTLEVAPDGTTYIAGLDQTTICDDPTCAGQPTVADVGGSMAIGEDGLPFFGVQGDPIVVIECADAACSTTDETVLGDSQTVEGFLPGAVAGVNGPSALVYKLPTTPGQSDPADLVLQVWDTDPGSANRVVLASGDAAGGLLFPFTAAAVGPDERVVVVWTRSSTEGDALRELVVARCDDRTCDTGTMATIVRGPLSPVGGVDVGADGLPAITYGVRREGFVSTATLRLSKCTDAGCTTGALNVETWGP